MSWYFSRNGQQAGPVEINVLQNMYATGQVQPNDLVWTEGMAQWLPASTVPSVTGVAPVPQAPVGRPVMGYAGPRTNYDGPVRPKTMQEVLYSPSGRICRSEFWLKGFLPLIGLQIVALIIAGILAALGDGRGVFAALGGLIYIAVVIHNFVSMIMLYIKRFHDHEKSGWHILIGLIPIVGGIYIIAVCWCMRGTIGPNEYGPDQTGGY